MTVIAWDGKTLAADRQVAYGNTKYETRKIEEIRTGVVCGMAGAAPFCSQVAAWIKGELSEYPKYPDNPDMQGSVVVVSKGREYAELYSSSEFPEYYYDKYFAIGSGRDFALAAMHLGKTAREAVELACQLDTGCGKGIDVIEVN